MVIIIVLWEVIDPEAVAFIDPWGEQEGKIMVNVAWGTGSRRRSLQPRIRRVCQALGRPGAWREERGPLWHPWSVRERAHTQKDHAEGRAPGTGPSRSWSTSGHLQV